jgi:hypothetical protein
MDTNVPFDFSCVTSRPPSNEPFALNKVA